METNDNRISHEQFLINLQLEYLTHRLRSLIYHKENYATVAADIAEKKRKKIKELGQKFRIKTIFDTDYNVKDFVSLYFWPERGLPNFQYKDEEQHRVQGNYDKWYLLFRGTKVTFKEKEVEIISNNPAREEVVVRTSQGIKERTKYSELTIKKDFKWI